MLNTELFLQTLPTVFYGMCGIFIVIGIVYVGIKLLCKAFEVKGDER